MSLGFLSFMTMGVVRSVTFRPLEGKTRTKAIQVHAVLQVLALSCALAGLAAIVQNKVHHNKPHLKSLHAKCGAITAILAVSASAGGVTAFRKMGVIQKFPERMHKTLKWMHRNLGLITYYSGLLTIEIALTHAAVYKPGWTQVWQVLIAMLATAMLLLVLQRDRSKLPVYQQPALDGQQPGKLQ
ncbi:hypothetical protein ABBQ38_013964 [Trebouxia sp. C0009 RCD-2024]